MLNIKYVHLWPIFNPFLLFQFENYFQRQRHAWIFNTWIILTGAMKANFILEKHTMWGQTVFFFFGLFRATPVAYGGSQARGSNQSCSCWPTPQPQQCQIQAASANCTAAQGNTSSLTHWARPGIEPVSSWTSQIRFCWTTTGTPKAIF